jgi:hypothetical protein
MKAYGGADVQIHIFLTSTLDGGEWSVSRPWRFTPAERAPLPIGQKVMWTPEPVQMTRRKFLNLPGLELRALKSASP